MSLMDQKHYTSGTNRSENKGVKIFVLQENNNGTRMPHKLLFSICQPLFIIQLFHLNHVVLLSISNNLITIYWSDVSCRYICNLLFFSLIIVCYVFRSAMWTQWIKFMRLMYTDCYLRKCFYSLPHVLLCRHSVAIEDSCHRSRPQNITR